jgi:hypothetical protein
MINRIGVVGLGYVGLPLACAFASKSFKVIGLDTDLGKIELIKRGETPIYEEGLQELLRKVLEEKSLKVTSSYREMGIIDYRSPIRDLEGRRTRDWVRYKLTVNRIDYGEVRENAKKASRRFTCWASLRKVIDYINQNPKEELTYRGLADKLGISEDTSSRCLRLLNSIGYLSSEFRGNEVQSIAKANENTILLYQEFFEPIARMCRKLDPDAQGFRDKLEYYLDHRDLWREHLKTQVYIYDKERFHVGFVGGEVRRLILRVLEDGEVKKLSHICYDVNRISLRRLTSNNIQ